MKIPATKSIAKLIKISHQIIKASQNKEESFNPFKSLLFDYTYRPSRPRHRRDDYFYSDFALCRWVEGTAFRCVE